MRLFKTMLMIAIGLSLCGRAAAQPCLAFSLREAQRRAQRNPANDKELRELGGINRILGMVHDPDGQDVILVGVCDPARPAVTLDDLVVALRARLIHDEWPSVSIDPLTTPSLGSYQRVKFGGQIQNSRFGKLFLDCDVILKRYAMGLSEMVSGVDSYRAYCEQDMAALAKGDGAQVLEFDRFVMDEKQQALAPMQSRKILNEDICQSRFWFYPVNDQSVAETSGVLVIPRMRVGVRVEICSPLKSQSDAMVKGNKNADLFSKQFEANFQKVSAQYDTLKYLLALYELVTVSEGIARLSHFPDFDFLLYRYAAAPEKTLETYDLIQACSIARRSDHRDHLLNLSGGIEARIIVERLNAGDVAFLRNAVIGARPDAQSLSWPLPVAGWRLLGGAAGNAAGKAAEPDKERAGAALPEKRYGCLVSAQSCLLGSDLDVSNNLRKFSGFPPLPPPPPPFVISAPRFKYSATLPAGVDMDEKVNDASLSQDKSGELKTKRGQALDSRPSQDSLIWKIPRK